MELCQGCGHPAHQDACMVFVGRLGEWTPPSETVLCDCTIRMQAEPEPTKMTEDRVSPPLDLEAIEKRLRHVTADRGPTAFLQAYLEALATRDVPALLAECARLRAAQQWQPISTAPKGELVLLYFPADRYLGPMVTVELFPPTYPRKPTFWKSVMPLPPAPETV